MEMKLSILTVLALSGLANATALNNNSIRLNLTPVTQVDSSVLCQDNHCTWNNSAAANLSSNESDNSFCRGTNAQIGGTGIVLGAGAYNMQLPSGIAKSKFTAKHNDVILQLFNTPYKNITPQMLKKYVELGYGSIWISPPQKNAYVPYWKKTIPAWYGAYQPVDFGQIGDKDNVMSFGSAEELANLVNEAHHAGLQVVVDLAIHQFAQPGVANTHFYADYKGQKYSFESGNMNAIQTFWWPQSIVKNYLPLKTEKCSSKTTYDTKDSLALVGHNPNNTTFKDKVNASSPWADDFSGTSGWFDGVLPAGTNSSIGVDSISCRTKEVFNGFAAWLLGADYSHGSMSAKSDPQRGFNVDGFRIDDISGQSVEFYTQLFKATAKYNQASNNFFGEYPTESATDYNKYVAINTANANVAADNKMKMLNFPLLVALKQALIGNKFQSTLQSSFDSQYAYKGIGNLEGKNAINLVIDQDTAPDSISSRAMCSWDGKPQQPDYVMNYTNAPLAYGVILAMEGGTPYVFADLQAEKQLGLTESGVWSPEVANGSVSYWNQNEVLAGIYFHNQTRGKTMHWGEALNANDDVAAFTRGDNYFFIVNKSQNGYQANEVSAELKDGSYIDLMSHQIVKVQKNTLKFIFIPKQSVMYFVPYHG